MVIAEARPYDQLKRLLEPSAAPAAPARE